MCLVPFRGLSLLHWEPQVIVSKASLPGACPCPPYPLGVPWPGGCGSPTPPKALPEAGDRGLGEPWAQVLPQPPAHISPPTPCSQRQETHIARGFRVHKLPYSLKLVTPDPHLTVRDTLI